MLILCASVKSYQDAWRPFDTLFNRMWPDCPYEKVLFSDRHWPDGMKSLGVFTIHWLEHDGGWIQNLLTMLERNGPSPYVPQLERDTVMVFQEDFFLTYPVDQSRIAGIHEWFITSDFDACWLYPLGYNEGPEVYPGIAAIPVTAPYRASCQVAIWKRERLIELCSRLRAAGHNTVQHYELYGSQMIDDFRLCGWIRKDNAHPETWPISYQCSAIARGKWMAGAVKFCLDQGIVLNPKREILWAEDANEALWRGRYDEFVREMEAKQA